MPGEYWEHRFNDLFFGFAAALGPRKKDETLSLPGLGTCLPARSGRAGLVAAIKALNLPPGARIGVPLYCCHVVFKAITAAGCRVRFIDIDPETFCISPEDVSKKHSHIDAAIAVHMFGNLCDMSSLLEAAQGKPIIEDCAQSLGSMLNGRMAGSFGAMTFFSFRSGKYLSVGEGGALFASDADMCSRASQVTAEMPAPGRGEECAHVAKTYIKSLLRSRPLYGMVGYQLWNILGNKMNLSEKSGIAISQIYRADLAIIRKRLPLLDAAIKKQRANADFYASTLKLAPAMLCQERPGTFYNRYHYPVTFPTMEHRDFIADYMLRQHVGTIKYLDTVADIATKNYGYTGDCPVAEKLSKRVLILPSYHSLKKRDIQHIAQCLNEGWAQVIQRD